MDISQVKYFLSAANIGSFTMAALENNISQSSFSKQIMNLESELGTKLFFRRQRHIELTEAGEQFRMYALQILQDYNEMLRGMESYSESQTLPVSICSIPVWQQYNLGKIIFELQKKYPDIILSIEEKSESSEVKQLLHRGNCDFAVLRTDYLQKELYDIYEIIRDELVVIVSKDHPLANQGEVSLSEFSDCRFVVPPEESDLRKISQNACIKSGFKPEIGLITSGNVNLNLDVVEQQNLVYLTFERVIRYYMLNRRNCRLLHLREKICSVTAFVSLKSKLATKAHEKVSEYLREEFGCRSL